MKTNVISKSLEEIWEIKERIYEEDKDCSLLESLKRAQNVAEQILKEKDIDKKLIRIGHL